jgi:hypothetical protein
MSIQLSLEQEQVVGKAIIAGLIRVPEDVVEVGVEAIRRQLATTSAVETMPSVEDWSRQFHTWVHSHSIETPVLSDEAMSRDSIYGLRGV